MTVVADASPLIFLAKIRRLGLIAALLGSDVRLPRAVRDEVLSSDADPVELEHMRVFLRSCRVLTVGRLRRFASAMSRADNEALTLAVRSRAGVLLCDDRLTRLMAEAEGVRPLGTLGILLRAMRRGLLAPGEARNLVDVLVSTHGFRIGIELYQLVLAEIEAGR